jgi:2-desacetyl-2-hydroxyethyl bacteriochlorophyllide A dehydrogenase
MKVTGVHIDGGMAEFISVPSHLLVHGNGLSVEALALVEPFCVAAHGIKRAAVIEKEFVLVIGAGPIGLATMAFAGIAGGRVIAVDLNETRLKFCSQNLGVAHVLNAGDPALLDKVAAITGGDMPSVVIDATGNQKAINNAFRFMAHGARYVLIGLQKGEISVSHPEFHKREGTLMSSRNATRPDFEYVIDCIKKGLIDPNVFITHRLGFTEVKEAFPVLFQTGEVIKAVVSFGD